MSVPQPASTKWDWKAILTSYPTRLTTYGVAAFLLCQAVFVAIREQGIEVAASENGPVEQAQAWMAVFACSCLFFAASRIRNGRTGLVLCACMVGYAAARECDTTFETMFFDDAYKYIAGIPLLTIAASAFWMGRKVVFRESLVLVRTPAITIFAIAGIYICTVCQVLDRPDLWSALGEGVNAETTKAAVEEFAELFGYLLLAFSGIESIALALVPQRSLQVIPAPSEAAGQERKQAA